MVRANVVGHPSQWKECGFNEIMNGRKRYGIIDRVKLAELLEISKAELPEFYNERSKYILSEQDNYDRDREPAWSESIAVGSSSFTKNICEVIKSRKRKVHNDIPNKLSILT